jgi:hypothetical protein
MLRQEFLKTEKYGWQQGIEAWLESAKAKALPTADYMQLKQRQALLFKKIRHSGEPNAVGEFLRIEDVLEESRLHFYTLSEFRHSLVLLGYGNGEIIRILAHQNAYTSMAERLLEAKIFYLLELSMQPQGGSLPYAAQPSVRIFHPEDWSGDEIHDAEKRIRLAPNAFGFGLDGRKLKQPDIRHPLSFSF